MQGIFAAGAHSDYGMLTLLATDDAPGLQIWLESAGRFVDVPPRKGAFIINLGDMLERYDCWSELHEHCHLAVSGAIQELTFG